MTSAPDDAPEVDREVDAGLLDEAWLTAPSERSRLRLALVAVLASAVCFLGGTLTQKHFGTDPAATAGPGGQVGLPAGLPDGFPGGGAGGFPESGQAEPDSQAVEADASESVIGTVVEIKDGVWVVEDLGGERHEIVVSVDTKLTRETSLTAQDIKAGDRVQITGTKRDQQLQADDVTQR